MTPPDAGSTASATDSSTATDSASTAESDASALPASAAGPVPPVTDRKSADSDRLDTAGSEEAPQPAPTSPEAAPTAVEPEIVEPTKEKLSAIASTSISRVDEEISAPTSGPATVAANPTETLVAGADRTTSPRPASPASPERARRPLRRPARTAVLTVHVLVSVGWNGVAFAQLVLASSAAADPGLRHSAYELMHIIDRALNIPLALLTLASGILISTRTRWGLLRHWWVVSKLAITVVAVIFAGSVMRTLIVRAGHATGPHHPAYGAPTVAIIVGACLMNVAFITATVLSTAKPWGRTPRGRREATTAATGPLPVIPAGPVSIPSQSTGVAVTAQPSDPNTRDPDTSDPDTRNPDTRDSSTSDPNASDPDREPSNVRTETGAESGTAGAPDVSGAGTLAPTPTL